MPKKPAYKCVVSGKPIPKERVEALISLGIPETRWTCVEHALDVPRKGIYLGEVGTSELLIVDKVYNDSVRSVFRGSSKAASKASTEAEAPDDGEESSVDYNERELNYYNSSDEQVDPEEKIEIIKRHNP
jgi:hypothetical protein